MVNILYVCQCLVSSGYFVMCPTCSAFVFACVLGICSYLFMSCLLCCILLILLCHDCSCHQASLKKGNWSISFVPSCESSIREATGSRLCNVLNWDWDSFGLKGNKTVAQIEQYNQSKILYIILDLPRVFACRAPADQMTVTERVHDALALHCAWGSMCAEVYWLFSVPAPRND